MKAKQAGILSAILASTCCIGPLLLVAIGVSSSAALAGRYHLVLSHRRHGRAHMGVDQISTRENNL